MDIQLNETYKVKVIKIIDCGCIVELEDSSTQLIHLSQISPEFVSNVEEYVSIGDTFDAVGVLGTKNPVQLSLKHLGLKSPYAHMRNRNNRSNNSNRNDTNRQDGQVAVRSSTSNDSRLPRYNNPDKVHTPRTSSVKSDPIMRGYESKDDDYPMQDFTKSRNAGKKKPKQYSSDSPQSHGYNKQRRKDKRNRDNRHRKDKYFD